MFNQGSIFDWNKDQVFDAMDKAVEKVSSGEKNINGGLLREKLTYAKTLDQILGQID